MPMRSIHEFILGLIHLERCSECLLQIGLVARGGYGKTRGGHKVQRGHNLSDLAQLLTPLSFYKCRAYTKEFFLKIKIYSNYLINREYDITREMYI